MGSVWSRIGYRYLPALLLAAAAPSESLLAAPAARTAAEQPGMVITGDREAPLVLYIVPWQEPALPPLPTVPLRPLVPQVLDEDYARLPATAPANRPAEAH